MDKVSKEIWFTLSEAETINRAREAAAVRNDRLALEFELKEHNKDVKKLIEKKESELSDLMQQIRTGKQSRIVSCQIQKDYATKTMKYFYEDQLVDERPMTSEERQMPLDFIGGGKAGVN
jgi:hypothetical protein